MVEIRNGTDLERWLQDKPAAWSGAIAARYVLRLISVAGLRIQFSTSNKNWRNNLFLPAFRFVRMSIGARIISGDVANIGNLMFLFHPRFDSSQIAYLVFSAARSVDANTVSENIHAAAAAASVIKTGTFLVDSTGIDLVRDSIWSEIDADIDGLISGDDISEMPLWKSMPEFAISGWNNLKFRILRRASHWKVWIDWYEDQLNGREWSAARGRPINADQELEFNAISDSYWRMGGKHVNAIIKQLELKYWGDWENRPVQDPLETVDIPAPKRAAIEPEWTDEGQLVLPTNALKADSSKDTLDAALAAVKLDLADLISDARTISNIDQRFVDYLERLAGRIPATAPSQIELFRIAHAEQNLRGQMTRVAEEWPDYLAVHYSGAVLSFDRVIRQFPAWREFRRNAEEAHLAAEEITTAPIIADGMSEALTSEDFADIVDPAIPNTLRALLAERPREDWETVVDSGMEALAADVLESASNILKRLLQPIIETSKSVLRPASNWISEDLVPELAKKKLGKRAAKSLAGEAAKRVDNIGPALTKLIKRVVMVGGAGCGIGAMHILGWLAPVWKIIEKTGLF